MNNRNNRNNRVCRTCGETKPKEEFRPITISSYNTQCLDCEINYLNMLKWANINRRIEEDKHK